MIQMSKSREIVFGSMIVNTSAFSDLFFHLNNFLLAMSSPFLSLSFLFLNHYLVLCSWIILSPTYCLCYPTPLLPSHSSLNSTLSIADSQISESDFFLKSSLLWQPFITSHTRALGSGFLPTPTLNITLNQTWAWLIFSSRPLGFVGLTKF